MNFKTSFDYSMFYSLVQKHRSWHVKVSQKLNKITIKTSRCLGDLLVQNNYFSYVKNQYFIRIVVVVTWTLNRLVKLMNIAMVYGQIAPGKLAPGNSPRE